MAEYTWSVTGPVMGYEAVAGADVPDAIEELPSRALARLLDRGYIQAKVAVEASETVVESAEVDLIVVLTQAAYTALEPKDDRTLYVIEG